MGNTKNYRIEFSNRAYEVYQKIKIVHSLPIRQTQLLREITYIHFFIVVQRILQCMPPRKELLEMRRNLQNHIHNYKAMPHKRIIQLRNLFFTSLIKSY